MYEVFYRSLFRIRRVEEEVAKIYPSDKIKSPVHLSIGQEAVAVGACEALRPTDVVFGTYRGHALYLAKHGNLKKMIAELYGKVTGCAKGKGLPLIFICENNFYSIHSHQLARQPASNIVERARAYAIPADRIEDNDVLRIYDVVKRAAEAIRAGTSGPRFLECMTYRWKEHVGPNDDFDKGYRSITEAEPWFAKDQVKRIRDLLVREIQERIEAEVEAEIREAFEFAERSPFPPDEELYTDVFAEATQWSAS